MQIDEAEFNSKAELFKFLTENKDTLIAQKKSITKFADGFDFISNANSVFKKTDPIKANENIENPPDDLNVIAIINTTNLMDSHLDVHIPGLWKKSIKENKSIMHLQEHQMKFDKIISDGNELKAYTKKYTWKELGFDFNGTTEALEFNSKILKSRNQFMHDQYAKGYVKQHSVGMSYVKIILCINSEETYNGAEKEAWDKYIEQVINREAAEKRGYFWAVTEAKVREGSAVPLGSNYATPTLDNNKLQPLKNTETKIEPSEDTRKREYYLNLTKN